LINPLRIWRQYEQRGWNELDDGAIWLDERRYDVVRGRNEVRHLIVRPDGTMTRQEHSVRFYTYPELESMLRNTGLSAEHSWGSLDEDDYTMDSPRLVISARKE
jgi:hypothetical protein